MTKYKYEAIEREIVLWETEEDFTDFYTTKEKAKSAFKRQNRRKRRRLEADLKDLVFIQIMSNYEVNFK